jgi:P27 family predicted phage terminase small subunit
MTTPKPPAHLSDATKAWWRAVVRDYVLEPHHLMLLEAACGAWDRLTQARMELSRDGLTVTGREGGIRAHPSIAVERDSRLAFARLVRELDLDTEVPSSGHRPPPLRSNRRNF